MAEQTYATQAAGRRSDFRDGYLTMLPLWLGAAPFGVIYAMSAVAAGLTPAQTLAMSLLVFAGASQFTAVGLIAAGAGPLAVTITTLVVNARHLLLTASLMPHLRGVGPWRRLLITAQLTDESYAVGIKRYLEGRGSAAFQIGCNLSLYTCWPLSALAGVLLGSAIPDPAAYGLDLVFPLTFIGLLVPLLRGPQDAAKPLRANRLVTLIALALTVAGALWLPGSWYVLLAGAGASGLGALLLRGLRPAPAGGADPTPGGAP